MKTALTTILFFMLCLLYSNNLAAQANTKSKELPYFGSLPYKNKLLQKVNENLFLLYTHPEKHSSNLIGFDANLKEVFKIETATTFSPQIYTGNVYATSFAYNKVADQILLVESYPSGRNMEFQARIFNTSGKLLKTEGFMLEGTIYDLKKVEISENGAFFSITQREGRKKENFKATVYTASLEKMYSKIIQTKEKEVVRSSTITDEGNLILVSDLAENKMEVKKYDHDGSVAHAFNLKKNVSGKEEYGNYLLKAVGERAVLAVAKNFSSSLMGIEVYDMNFQTKKATEYRSIEFNAENVAKLYGELNEDYILNKNNSLVSSSHKRPKHFENISLEHLLIEDDNIIVVSEVQFSKTQSSEKYQYTMYTAGDILISAFGGNKNTRNSIIGRQIIFNDALGGFNAFTTSVYLEKGTLQVLTSEYMKGDNKNLMMYHRKVDLNTGNVTAPKMLVDHYFWSNTGFIDWINAGTVILYRTEGMNFIKRGYTLNMVEVDKLPVQ